MSGLQWQQLKSRVEAVVGPAQPVGKRHTSALRRYHATAHACASIANAGPQRSLCNSRFCGGRAGKLARPFRSEFASLAPSIAPPYTAALLDPYSQSSLLAVLVFRSSVSSAAVLRYAPPHCAGRPRISTIGKTRYNSTPVAVIHQSGEAISNYEGEHTPSDL